ncbi:MAG TPA: YtxH domain-containing protein [Thermoleophilaceae bacterium]|nr:YtxH domain-containing protein [Thermoleophilaceae bacterium]
MGSKGTTGSTSDRLRLPDDWQAFMDRMARKDVPDEVAQRGQALADAIVQAAEEAAQRASLAWRESQPVRREVARTIERQGRQVGKWSRQVWRQDIRPGLRRAWNRRTVALGAAGAAVPAGRQLIEEAASELGLRPRQNRHWGSFFAGILIGALTGALVAILTAPKPGRETRDDLVARAREAAEAAGEWIPVNTPLTNGNGGTGVAPEVSEVESET